MSSLASGWSPSQRWGVAAATWCVAFGLLSLYWAAGGNLGINQLSEGLQEEAADRDAGFIALVAATGIAKIAGALVPLGLVFGNRGPLVHRLLNVLTWLGGVFLTIYGLGDTIGGSVRAWNGSMENAIWYAVLWGPIWLLGGILFLLTAWTQRRERRART